MFFVNFLLGYIYGLLCEWVLHKKLLHDYGKKKGSIMSFHFKEHHRNSRKFNFYDPNYSFGSIFKFRGYKEGFYLIILCAIHLPFLWISPGFFLAILVSVIEYYYKHIKSHINSDVMELLLIVNDPPLT